MVGFSDIDRRFRAPEPIKLECRNCDCTDSTVVVRLPRWFSANHKYAMCDTCWGLPAATSPGLIEENRDVLQEYYARF